MTAFTAPGDSWSGMTTNKDQVSIRSFVFPDDYAEVYNLWSQAGAGLHVGRSDSLEEISKKLQRDPDLFLVAEVNGRIIGSVMGGFDGRRGIVYHLGVSPDSRRNGVGRMLMEALEERLRAKGCLKSYLLVTKDNPEAIQFYEASGWEQMELYIYGKELGEGTGKQVNE